MIMISYNVKVRPFISKPLNMQEQLNEMTVLIAAYPLFCFTNFLWDTERRLEAGWFLVACIATNVLFNITFLLVMLCATNLKRFRRWWIRRQKIKAREAFLEKKRKAYEK